MESTYLLNKTKEEEIFRLEDGLNEISNNGIEFKFQGTHVYGGLLGVYKDKMRQGFIGLELEGENILLNQFYLNGSVSVNGSKSFDTQVLDIFTDFAFKNKYKKIKIKIENNSTQYKMIAKELNLKTKIKGSRINFLIPKSNKNSK